MKTASQFKMLHAHPRTIPDASAHLEIPERDLNPEHGIIAEHEQIHKRQQNQNIIGKALSDSLFSVRP